MGSEENPVQATTLRHRQNIMGPWRFQLDPDNLGEQEGWQSPAARHDGWGEAPVPAAWDTFQPALWAYEGVGWYAVRFNSADVPPGAIRRLVFGRVSLHARVWLNAVFLGEHFGGDLGFDFPIPPGLLTADGNCLVVRVDNAPRPEWLPGGQVIERVVYGGILRPVWIETLPACHLERVHVTPRPAGDGARLRVNVRVANAGEDAAEGWLEMDLAGEAEPTSVAFACPPGLQTDVRLDVEMAQAARWSPAHPALHELDVRLFDADRRLLDERRTRFGVRTVEARGRELLLNGEPIRVKGLCRYDEFYRAGPVATAEMIRQDLLAIKATGANFLRTHHPQEPLLLDLCDEIGFLVMEEAYINWWGIKWWDKAVSPADNAASILAQARADLAAMAERDYNHPALILWSMANESATDDPVGADAVRELMAFVRSLDPTRLVTFVVSGDAQRHPAFAEADVVCMNTYQGLFRGELARHIDEMDALVRQPTAEYLGEVAGHFPDKPLLITEFGTHGLRGCHGATRYTEEYQAAYLAAAWRAISATPGVIGGVVWVWADYYHRRDLIGKGERNYAAPFGPYGLVTIDRQPKLALAAVREMYGCD
jgi:beta-galactosidase/beta-glucuronidase